MVFSDILRNRRIELGQTLRQFAVQNNYDVAYLSRLENGILSAPADLKKLRLLAEALSITPGTVAWTEFTDAAAASRNELPDDLKDEVLMPKILPAFYRAVRNDHTEADIEQLIALIKGDTSNEGTRTAGKSSDT